METTTLLRLKTEQEKMVSDERRQKDAARAIIELAKQKREEAQKSRGYTIQDNARLVETCLEKTREQLRVCTGEKEVLEILSREKQRALDVAHEGMELYQRTVNASMLKNAKDLEIREIADRELNAGKAKLDERCGELDAAQCTLARMQKENQELKDDLGKAHEASQALICLSKNATDELRFCREDKLNMMSKVLELQKQLEAVQKELELEKVCHKKLMDDCREREAAVEGVSKKIMEENRRCIEREAALQKELQKREAELEHTKTEWQSSSKGLEDMKRIEILGTHIKQLAETSREFREELRVCTGEKEAMEQEINNLSRELEKAVSAKDNAEAKAQEAEHLVEKTREQLRVCTGEKKEMESLSLEKQRALDVAQEEKELYQRTVNEREGALQKELQKCEAQLECTKTELQNLYKGLEDMKKIEILFNASAVQLANASAAAEAFRNENGRCNEHIRTLEMSLEALNERCNEEIDMMKAANREMQASLDIAQIELETERDRGLSRERELLWECQKGGERLEQILEAMLLEPANKTLSTMEIQFQRLRENTERMKRKASSDAILALAMSERDNALTYALSQKGEELLQKERSISEFQSKYKVSVENLERHKKDLQEAQRSIAVLQAKIKSLESKCQGFQKEKERAESDLEETRLRLKEMAELRETKKAELGELRREYLSRNTASEEAREMSMKIDRTLRDLKMENQTVEMQLERMKKTVMFEREQRRVLILEFETYAKNMQDVFEQMETSKQPSPMVGPQLQSLLKEMALMTESITSIRLTDARAYE